MEPETRNFNIPFEICIQILSYLPVKSLLRFRIVSKEWKSIIENPDFPSLHLNHFPNNSQETYLLVLDRGRKPLTQENTALWFSRCTTTESYQQTQEFNFSALAEPLTDHDLFRVPIVLGDINGLLLLQKSGCKWIEVWTEDSVVLWNPSIRKRLNIPPPPTVSSESYSFFDLCLGYDPSTDDYKVVSFFSLGPQLIITEVFPLKSRAWRKSRGVAGNDLVCYPRDGGGDGQLKKVAIGGSVHWVEKYWYSYDDGHCECYKKAYISFNMTYETRSATPLPDDLSPRCHPTAVAVSGSLTGLLACRIYGLTDIWVLEKSGNWSKYYTLDTGMTLTSTCVTFLEDGRLIWRQDSPNFGGATIYAYDLNTKKASVVYSSCNHPIYCRAYIESLLLLK